MWGLESRSRTCRSWSRLLWQSLGLVSKFEPGLGLGGYGLDYITEDFCTARFFHLDKPDPNPVERKTISNPNPKKTKYPAGLDSKIRILYTTDGYAKFFSDMDQELKNQYPLTSGSFPFHCEIFLLGERKRSRHKSNRPAVLTQGCSDCNFWHITFHS